VAGDLAVLVVVERQHGEVGGLPNQDWSLRVTLVFRRTESGWKMAHLLAVLSIVVFWMAVPPLLGVAAVGLALDARDRRPLRGQRLANVAGVLGALATVAGLVLAFVG
jgi:hypothetical protein